MGLLLAVVYQATLKPIKASELNAKIAALEKVLPKFENNPLDNAQRVLLEGESDSLTVYTSEAGGSINGYAIETYSRNGFSGEINLMVGFEPGGVIKDFTVLKHAETPGLGAKMNEWFRSENRTEGTFRNFCGLSMTEEHPLSVSKDGGKVDAITASTITSRAFVDAIERAYRAYIQVTEGKNVEATTAATATAETNDEVQ